MSAPSASSINASGDLDFFRITLTAGQAYLFSVDTTTLIDANYVDYLFADGRHLTPEAHRLFGDYAYDQIIRRW